MVEWFIWFKQQIGNRNVLLILDGFSAHKSGLIKAQKDEDLGNIR